MFEADSKSQIPIWKVSFLNPTFGVTSVPAGDVGGTSEGGRDIIPEIGITGIGVIDPESNTYYIVSKTKENGAYVQRLHDLDVASGAERAGSRVKIEARLFDSRRQNQRAALTLSRGIVYISFASHEYNPPYHGWILGYDAQKLNQVFAFNDTPDGKWGGIWMNGDSPSVDDEGNLYVISGNGSFNPAQNNYGDSYLKLTPDRSGALKFADFFYPF